MTNCGWAQESDSDLTLEGNSLHYQIMKEKYMLISVNEQNQNPLLKSMAN
jgi:hypothetical protein